ncbi:TMM81 protein, partial [Bucco capensis]|nr:TMM81 protein [Bucco capensis]
FCLLLVFSSGEVTIPAELKSLVARVTINSTSCSVTCGLGVKLEETCELSPAGERKNCSLHKSICLSTWSCGLLLFTIPEGKALQLSCLPPDILALESGDYSYMWRLAPGLISTNDMLFEPLQNSSAVLSFSPAREADAGTYRCDMHLAKTRKLLKRIYFGLRVIQKDFRELDFENSLTSEQKLAENKQKGMAGKQREEVQEQEPLWQAELLYVCLLGAGTGVLASVLVSLALCFLSKALR